MYTLTNTETSKPSIMLKHGLLVHKFDIYKIVEWTSILDRGHGSFTSHLNSEEQYHAGYPGSEGPLQRKRRKGPSGRTQRAFSNDRTNQIIAFHWWNLGLIGRSDEHHTDNIETYRLF